MKKKPTHHAKESGLGKPMKKLRAFALATLAQAAAKRFGALPASQTFRLDCFVEPVIGCQTCRKYLADYARKIRAGRTLSA